MCNKGDINPFLLDKLSYGFVISIFIIYSFIFLISTIVIVLCLIKIELPLITMLDSFGLIIVCSIAFGLTGSCIFYIRKLYKICINSNLNEKIKENRFVQLGIGSYFLFRPLFSIIFSILIVVGLKSGLLFVHNSPNDTSDGFIYISSLLSFCASFLSGAFLSRLEFYSRSMIDKLFEKE